MQVICNDKDWWKLITYDGFKSHFNVTEGVYIFYKDNKKVRKDEAENYNKQGLLSETNQTGKVSYNTTYKYGKETNAWMN